jgi:hypothetical protein
MKVCMPEQMKIVEAITPQAGAAITGDYVSLKNTGRAFVVVHINQAQANTVAITIEQATAVAPTGSKAITTAVPIWANEDCAASDTLVRQTDAVSFTTSAAVKHKMIVFQIDPTGLDVANGFDCITVKTGASHADNITSAMYYLADYRYQQATPPTAVAD